MLILKVPAFIAAVLFMSSVSAQAMEFADRPGPISGALKSPSIVCAMPIEDRLCRRVNNHFILRATTATEKKLAARLRPVSHLIRIQVAQMMFERPGRLSAEFSAVARGSGIRFEYGPGVASSWLKPTATPNAIKFENRPGSVSNRFNTMPAVKFADRRGFEIH